MTTTTIRAVAPRSAALQLGTLGVACAAGGIVAAAYDQGWLGVWQSMLAGLTVIAGWIVAVLGREAERMIAMILAPVVLLGAVLCIVMITVVQPALDDVSSELRKLTGPVAGLDIGGAAGNAKDKILRAVEEARR